MLTHGTACIVPLAKEVSYLEKKKIRLLLVEPHLLSRWGLLKLLESQHSWLVSLQVVADVDGAKAALNALEQQSADIVMLANPLPDMDSFELCRLLIQANPQQGILVLADHTDLGMGILSILNGARGLLNKAHLPEHLLNALVAVYSGGLYLEPRTLELEKRFLTKQMGAF